MFNKYRKEIIISLASIIIFLFLAIYITFPLIFHLGDLVTGYGDELIIAWIQNWTIHSLFTNPFGLFDANLFYPYTNTLSYSDLHLASSLLSAIPLYFIKEPITAFNFTVISSITLVPFSIFLLSKYLTKNYLASLLSGILVQFAPAFLDKKVHIQILALQWIPLSALFFIRFQKSKHTRYLVLSMFFFLLQTYNSFMPGYFLVLFYTIYVCFVYFRDKNFLRILVTKHNLAVLFTTIILLMPIVIPYYTTSIKYHAFRNIRDAIHFAIQPEDLLYPDEHTRLQGYLLALPFNQHSQNGEFKPGYLGLVFTLLTIIVLFYSTKNIKKNNFLLKCFIITSLAGLIFSFGPALHLGRQTIHIPFPIPLPYALFYYILPGFQGFRNSARFEMMFILFIAVAIAILLTQVLKKYHFLLRNAIYIILIFGAIIEYNYPMKFQHIPQKKEFPKVFNWLNTTSGNSSSIIMPIYNWYMYGSSEEFKRDYYSTANWRRTVNGASGYAPPQWEHFVAEQRDHFPDKSTLENIKKTGVNYIIVDKSAYDKEFKIKQQLVDGKSVIDALKREHSLKFVKSFDNYFVYEFINLK